MADLRPSSSGPSFSGSGPFASASLPYLTIREIRSMLDSGEITSEALTRAHLDRIAAVDPHQWLAPPGQFRAAL